VHALLAAIVAEFAASHTAIQTKTVGLTQMAMHNVNTIAAVRDAMLLIVAIFSIALMEKDFIV
jgi:aspartyl aminopeptidase